MGDGVCCSHVRTGIVILLAADHSLSVGILRQ